MPSNWCASASVQSPCALCCDTLWSQMPTKLGSRLVAASTARWSRALCGDQACRATCSKHMRTRQRASRTLERHVSAAAAMTHQPSSTARSARTPALCQSLSARRIRACAAVCPVCQEQSAATSSSRRERACRTACTVCACRASRAAACVCHVSSTQPMCRTCACARSHRAASIAACKQASTATACCDDDSAARAACATERT